MNFRETEKQHEFDLTSDFLLKKTNAMKWDQHVEFGESPKARDASWHHADVLCQIATSTSVHAVSTRLL
jgi:hypothetical protein